jgi:hypothetical protein
MLTSSVPTCVHNIVRGALRLPVPSDAESLADGDGAHVVQCDGRAAACG